jgi:hypothetical protein
MARRRSTCRHSRACSKLCDLRERDSDALEGAIVSLAYQRNAWHHRVANESAQLSSGNRVQLDLDSNTSPPLVAQGNGFHSQARIDPLRVAYNSPVHASRLLGSHQQLRRLFVQLLEWGSCLKDIPHYS